MAALLGPLPQARSRPSQIARRHRLMELLRTFRKRGGILIRFGIRMRLRDDGEHPGGTTKSIKSSGTREPAATAHLVLHRLS
jgi:hypothetical protein